jgi:hypothetical protein
MIRPLFTETAMFLAPFALYAIYLWATSAKVVDINAWSVPTLAWLTIAALALMIASFVIIAEFSGAPPGSSYVPAHVEDGRVVPGIEK